MVYFLTIYILILLFVSLSLSLTHCRYLQNKNTIYIFIPGSDDYIDNIRMTAIQLVDNVLEQSVLIINSQQHSSNTLHSESEHFAITCDVNGVDLIKSPTIESMSGKSFDDNLSVPDLSASYNMPHNNLVDVNFEMNNMLNSSNNMNAQFASRQSNDSDASTNSCSNINANELDQPIEQTSFSKRNSNESNLGAFFVATTAAQSNQADNHLIASGSANANDTTTTNDAKKLERIERKFETLSSQLHVDQMTVVDYTQNERHFEMAMSQINSDELSNLQRDFSKISWDDSLSTTTAELAALTPDKELHDLPKGD